jgi:hypothetical protein
MRRSLGVLSLTTAALLLWPAPPLQACGDKLLSIARNMRLKQVPKARHPASILVYAGRAVDANRAGDKKPLVQMSLLYMTLRVAGHKPWAASNAAELEEALRMGKFDFVVADLADASALVARLGTQHSGAMVVPVVGKGDNTGFAAAQAQFKLVLKTPTTFSQHIHALDAAMKERSARASGP